MERIFIAIYPGSEIIEKLKSLQNEIRGTLAGRLIEPSNIHLTLQFIGWVKKENMATITENIKRSIIGITPLEVSYKSCGFFPTSSSPRILWVGVEQSSSILPQLVENLKRENGDFLNPREKKRIFLPHITIARIKSIDKRNSEAIIKRYGGFYFGAETVKEICLAKSELKRSSAQYAVVKKFALG